MLLLPALAMSANAGEFTAAQWLEKGHAFQAQKDYANAIAAYSQAITLDPQLEQAFFERGKMYLHTKQITLAKHDFTKAIELNPDKGHLYWFRGLAYAWEGQHALAINEYNQSLRLDPQLFPAYWTSALSHERIGMPNRALPLYQRFVELAPPDFPDVSQAKNRIAQLQAQDTARLDASAESIGHLQGEHKQLVFDFLKTDFLTVDLGQPRWKIGFQQSGSNGLIVELITGNETVKDWTELVTVQFLPSLKHISPSQYAAFIEKQYREMYGEKARVKLLRNSADDSLVEYMVVGQPGTKDEYTLTRILKGRASLILVHYGARPDRVADYRQIGPEILKGIRYSEHFPQS